MREYIEKNRNMVIVFVSTFIFMMLSYLFCYTNLNLSHDSLVDFNVLFSASHQIEIGRFINPVLGALRGVYSSPVIIGAITYILVGLSSYYLCKIFNINKKMYLIILSGIISTFYPLVLLNNTFIELVDIYMLDFFLMIMSVYLWKKYDNGWLYIIIPLFICFASYQAYISVFISLVMFISFISIFDNESKVKNILNKILKALLSIIMSAILYFVIYKLIVILFNVNLVDDYNSIANLFNFSDIGSIFTLFGQTYSNLFENLFNSPSYFKYIVNIINLAIVLFTLYLEINVIRSKKINSLSKILILVIALLFPFGMNISYFLSNGVTHHIMLMSNVLIYVFPIVLLNYLDNKQFFKSFIIYSYIFIIFSSVIYSNQISVKKDIELKTTLSVMNRIIYHIEDMDEYEFNKTPVVFIGYLKDGPLERPDRLYDDATGTWYAYALTYEKSYHVFINNYLGYDMKNVYTKDFINDSNKEYIKNMPNYPNKNAIQYIDGTIVVKLSDYYSTD